MNENVFPEPITVLDVNELYHWGTPTAQVADNEVIPGPQSIEPVELDTLELKAGVVKVRSLKQTSEPLQIRIVYFVAGFKPVNVNDVAPGVNKRFAPAPKIGAVPKVSPSLILASIVFVALYTRLESVAVPLLFGIKLVQVPSVVVISLILIAGASQSLHFKLPQTKAIDLPWTPGW